MRTTATRRLGAILVDAKVLAEPSLADALDRQRESGKRLGAILVEMGLVDEKTIVAALGVQMDLSVVDLRHRTSDDDAVALLPENVARTFVAAPVRRTSLGLEIAVAEPLDKPALAQLERVVGEQVVMRLAAADDVRRTIEGSYRFRVRGGRSPPVPHPDSVKFERHESRSQPGEHDREILEAMVSDATRAGASDIHIELSAVGPRVRYRIDGVLTEVATWPNPSVAAVVRHAKELSVRPRRGQRERSGFNLTVDGRDLRLVLTAFMTVQGERVRLRLVTDRDAVFRGLDQLGMPAAIYSSFTAHLRRPSGLIVIAGPRGSGRTTTAYAAVSEMDTPERSIIMIERAPARILRSVSQIEIGGRPVVPAILAAVEDEDADVVVIDDLEGVRVTRAAIRMAGHGILVVVTVTAVDAAAAIARLLSTGVSRSQLATARLTVLAQRLEHRADPGAPDSPFALFELVGDD